MRLGAVAVQFRLEQGAQEEGVTGEFGDPDLPVVVEAAEPQPAAGQGLQVGRVQPVAAVVALGAPALPAGHPLAGRRALRLPDLADSRWIEAGQVAPPLAEIRRHAGVEGFRPFLHYDGEDIMAMINLAAAGHGLTLLPEPVIRAPGIATVRVTEPRVSHRVELLHAALRADSPAAALADILTER